MVGRGVLLLEGHMSLLVLPLCRDFLRVVIEMHSNIRRNPEDFDSGVRRKFYRFVFPKVVLRM